MAVRKPTSDTHRFRCQLDLRDSRRTCNRPLCLLSSVLSLLLLELVPAGHFLFDFLVHPLDFIFLVPPFLPLNSSVALANPRFWRRDLDISDILIIVIYSPSATPLVTNAWFIVLPQP